MASHYISNSKLFDEGMKKARKIIEKHMWRELTRVTHSLAIGAARYYYEEGGPMMTGNTITSYTARFWHKGAEMATFSASEDWRKPIRTKLTEGEVFPAGATRYDGENQSYSYKAEVITDRDYGENTAFKFLSGATPSGATYIIRLTTGTEYSEWLENMRQIDVLTNYSYRVESDMKWASFWNKLH
ncbi:MAG: hypothetical protein LIP09_14260 [Bacteroidales bacterium]|nr:hypothetical protein [Bacteroidales bacterium]MCC8119892.1 hypothetical protein [Bacteroidales bacterium]